MSDTFVATRDKLKYNHLLQQRNAMNSTLFTSHSDV